MFLFRVGRAGAVIALTEAIFLPQPTITAHQEHIEVEIVEEVDESDKMSEYFETHEGNMYLECVYAEAGNQGYKGMRKVAAVIKNRQEGDDFPNTIEKVITQKLKTYMFSSYPDGMKKWANDAHKSDVCKQAIWDEINERSDTEIVYFRTGRYSDYGTPAYIVGDHFFSTR